MNILWLQKNTRKAGAQHCLSRILRCEALKQHQHCVVSGMKGWMPEWLREHNFHTIRDTYPSSRSLFFKLLGRHIWRKQIQRKLEGFLPDVIVANNHIECLHGLELQKSFPKAKLYTILRDPELNRKNYLKYRCQDSQRVYAVSQWMKDQLPFPEITVLRDGLLQHEIREPTVPKHPLKKVLVLGDPSPRKGWLQFLKSLEGSPETASIEFDFTGIPSSDELLRFTNLENIHIRFLDPFPDLAKASLDYDLCIATSSSESFGMAALEVAAMGKPVFAFDVGVMKEFLPREYIADSHQDLLEKINSFSNFEHPRLLQHVHEMISKYFNLEEEWKNVF